jgi:catechol-2,3-dioxygenase
MAKPKIKHVAVRAADPEKLAAFLQEVFDVKVVKRTPRGTMFLTDGYLNLALIAPRPGEPNGINHYGFLVDDVEAIGKLTPIQPTEQAQEGGRSPGQHSESIIRDPEGNRIDVADEMWPI